MQIFFAHILEKEMLKKAEREKGKFRNFLLGALLYVVANERDKQRTLKRGGGIRIVSIDEAQAEGLYCCELVDSDTPEKAFDRRWAAALLRQTYDRLRKEHLETGKSESFAILASFLTDEPVRVVMPRPPKN